ncbi:MAG: YgiQ family radical SAM protein [Christensenellaceae bacterium]|jgi:uncharacterized radical SAM protein YgiQ|nr:YgiQ family radical SAM protein [Christensenellaceae bacterium]
MPFLPTTREEMLARGWQKPDFILVSGDAYVDHPSFGHALIARVLEADGFKVAILAQPRVADLGDFYRLGEPKLGFLVAAGNIDSMVNHYTSMKRPRSSDVYSPGGKAGLRPDRATIVYCNKIHEAFGGRYPIVIGGIEASLRRFAHYDYWSNKVRHSVLSDAGADLLLYGMAERQMRQAARRLSDGLPLEGIAGSCVLADEMPEGALEIPSFMAVRDSKAEYARAFKTQYEEQDPIRGRTLCQRHEKKVLVAYPPAMPLSRQELDEVYALPFERRAHPSYAVMGGVPALKEVEWSITATRGCFGGCNFCALGFHQGRIVQSRSEESLLGEAAALVKQKGFKGYIHDLGGPTANFRYPACKKQLELGSCKHRQCLVPEPCPNLIVQEHEFASILRKMRGIAGIKKVFVRSGLRFDYMMLDKDETFWRELVEHHISGQLKVAPEHVSPGVLRRMGKPGCAVYEAFRQKYEAMNERLGKEQFLVPYFISAHPGSTLKDAIELALYLKRIGHQPEQVQDFYPTPGTLSTAMWHTGKNPLTGEPVYIPGGEEEKLMQRALLQFQNPLNHALVRRALRKAGRADLIGYGPRCLVPPEKGGPPKLREGKRAQPKQRRARQGR